MIKTIAVAAALAVSAPAWSQEEWNPHLICDLNGVPTYETICNTEIGECKKCPGAEALEVTSTGPEMVTVPPDAVTPGECLSGNTDKFGHPIQGSCFGKKAEPIATKADLDRIERKLDWVICSLSPHPFIDAAGPDKMTVARQGCGEPPK